MNTLEEKELELLREILFHCDQNGNGYKATRARYFSYMKDGKREREFLRTYNSMFTKLMKNN